MRRYGACAMLLLVSCSSATPSAPTPSNFSPAGPTVATSVASSGPAVVQAYVDSVNALCDALLPKILQVTNGGHPGTYPVAEFLAEQPEHAKLEAQFDAQLEGLPVPTVAIAQAAALRAYVDVAKQIDAKRIAAAQKGQAAFDAEVKAEAADANTDRTIAARNAAGFHPSCNAR